MKSIIIILLFMLITPYSINAQDSTENKKAYKIWANLDKDTPPLMGYLYAIKDSTIIISNIPSKYRYPKLNFAPSELSVNQIESIQLRNRNSIKQNGLIGALLGGTIGILIAQGNAESNCTEDEFFCLDFSDLAAISGGVIGCFVGGGVGAMTGLIRFKIPINKSYLKYNSKKYILKKYTIIN